MSSPDTAIPTLVRYLGFALTVVLSVLLVLGLIGVGKIDPLAVIPAFVPAAGLMAYKWVHDGARIPSPPTSQAHSSEAKTPPESGESNA